MSKYEVFAKGATELRKNLDLLDHFCREFDELIAASIHTLNQCA